MEVNNIPKKLLRCVAKVKAKSKGKYNPWAVCIASTGLHPYKHKKHKKR